MHVHIIEDNQDIAYLLKSVLEEDRDEGISSIKVTSRDFESTLTREAWAGIDAALVDYMLPGMTGLDIMRYLAGEFPDIRRVLITAVDQTYLPKQVLDFADDVLMKPVPNSHIIVRALRGHA